MDLHTTTFADLDRIAKERGVKGTVATGKGLIPHTQASLVGRAGTPNQKWRRFPTPSEAQVRAELSADLPVVMRRSARERYKVLVRRLFDEGLASYKRFGYPVWPASIQNELTILGWKEGHPDLRGQVEALASRYIEQGARIQKEKDAHKVTLDYHGHLSA